MMKREHNQRLPWDTWDLDKSFFKELNRYSAEHPESTLDRVLERVKAGLEQNKELFELVPESPFPARGLVKALAHLIKLGVTVTRAKANVQQFAETVVAWVLDVKATFQDSNGKRFTWVTWKHLEKMRDLVNEIFLWATTRLNDRRWSRISGGVKIGSEIADFNARITDAKELFRDLSIITFASGLDAILAALRLLLGRQDGISTEIKKIRQNQCRQMDYLIDEFEAQKQKEERRAFLASTLTPLAVANPTYNKQGKLPCDEGTRVAVLAEIMDWIKDVSATSQSFLWLSGDPGCGKSAITASIARECKDLGILWAQFFINRNNEETTNPNLYFPSIAQQLISRSTDVEMAVYDALKAKPSLLDQITPEQAAKLFIDSIAVATGLDPQRPVVVVIDGLDETDHKRLRDTAVIFSCLFKGLVPFHNAKLFVSSRTEDDIRNPFAKNMIADQVKHLHLDTFAQSSIEDVSFFLRRKIEQIVEENDLNWTVWPGERRMQALAARASGLFIWAVTVANFLQQQVNALGTECLEDILNILSGDALGDINTLYSVILRLTYQGQTDPWEFEKFRRIVGAIITLRERLCLQDLSALLSLRRTPTSPPVDIVKFVQRLRTVLVAGTEAVNYATIPRVHKSFYEYITSPSPDSHFQVEARVAEAELAVACFRQIAGFYSPDKAVESTLSQSFVYGYHHWSSHMQEVTGVKTGTLFISSAMDLQTLSDCLPALRSNQSAPPFHISPSWDHTLLYLASPGGVRSWEMGTGRRKLFSIIQATGVTSVAFSQKGHQLLYGSSKDPKVALFDLQDDTRHGLGALNLARLTAVTTVVYYRGEDKLGGEIFAVGFNNGEVRLWIPEIQQLVPFPSKHDVSVRCMAFSPSGGFLVSGSSDGALVTWHLNWPRIVRHTFCLVNHSQPIIFVKFIHSHLVVAVSSDGHIFFRRLAPSTTGWVDDHENGSWSSKVDDDVTCADLTDHDPTFQDHLFVGLRSGGGLLLSIDTEKRDVDERMKTKFALSLDQCGIIRSCTFGRTGGNLLALGSEDGAIVLMNYSTLKIVGPEKHYRHPSAVTALAFSPKNELLASVSDSIVRIWTRGGRLEACFPNTSAQYVSTFSSDQRMAATVSPTGVHLWDSRNLNNCSLVDRIGFRSVAFTPDNSRLIGISPYGVYVWDTSTKTLLASASQMFNSATVSIAFHIKSPSSRFLTIEEGGIQRVLGWDLQSQTLNCVDIVCDQFNYTPSIKRLDSIANPIRFGGLDNVDFYPPMHSTADGLWVCLENLVIRIREDNTISVVHVIPNAFGQTEDWEIENTILDH